MVTQSPVTSTRKYVIGEKLRLERKQPPLTANVIFVRKIPRGALIRIVRIFQQGQLNKVLEGSVLEAKFDELLVEIEEEYSDTP